jgi:hypothetical protein
MAQRLIQNNSSVNISRTQYSSSGGVASVQNLGNKLFNGYVYNMSLDIGFNGQATGLVLNLALNRTLKNVKTNDTINSKRKSDLSILNSTIASKNLTKPSELGAKGNIGTPSVISQLVDKDFQLDEQYMGINTSYNISIIDGEGNSTYDLKNFRISSYSLSKKNNEKILTVSFKDSSFVLSKIYVAILGEEIAVDERSERPAIIDKLQLSCPPVNGDPGGTKTLKNFSQLLHFSEEQLAKKLNVDRNAVDVIVDTSKTKDKINYIILKSKDPNKSVVNGYGAAIILGEEDFKDSPCESSDIIYSFSSLLAALKNPALGIKIYSDPLPTGGVKQEGVNYDSLQDKSKGRIKKKYHGTLKDVLNQWCDDYSFAYTVDFTDGSNITIKGIDLSGPAAKESVLKTKFTFEEIEAKDQKDFVIRSQDFNFDLSEKILKIYSSYYFKDAKTHDFSFQQSLGDKNFYAINLYDIFPQFFSNWSKNGLDFCGTTRSYHQVVTSAVLGKYSPRLRQIYNYSIGAYRALGFMPLKSDDPYNPNSQLPITDDSTLVFQEAVSKVLDMQADLLYDNLGKPLYNFNLGFYNAQLASQVENIESFIAEFVGKHYWTDEFTLQEGSVANENYYAKYEVSTIPAVQKVYSDQLYKIEAFQQAQFLLNQINSLFSGTERYFDAYFEFNKLQTDTKRACAEATASYQKYISSLTAQKSFRFYTARQGAAYGVLGELIKEIQSIEYRIQPSSELFQIDLADIYAPIFKQMSPTSFAALQTALPMNVSAVPLSDYKFGILAGFKSSIFSFTPIGGAVFTNPIEFQNSVRERCAKISGQLAEGNERVINLTKNVCNKTVLYTTCILPTEEKQIAQNNSAQLQAASGPDPFSCQRLMIYRKRPPEEIMQANIAKTLMSSNGFITLAPVLLGNILIQSAKSPTPVSYFNLGVVSESITLPSQRTYQIRLISTTSTQIYLPFQQYIRGGLEDASDIQKIIENDTFALDLFVNNITSNVRELFSDQTQPAYSSSTFINTQIQNNTPFIMDYQGYNDTADSPKYEFKTFEQFHSILKSYFDDRTNSLREPAVSYSNDIFCSKISTELKSLLNVKNGLTKLNITLGERGLNIQCEFQSRPPRLDKLETLIYKNRPNIKLQNINLFK